MNELIILTPEELEKIIDSAANMGMFEGLYLEKLTNEVIYKEQKALSEAKIKEVIIQSRQRFAS
ncbi:hypothetical protein [Dysgonomonas massiliensis]|uniref:hypothetical protein n=1 Tax=Dysgonomonas massiliensis TaxID=2040292 RepID=UPI000C78B363|nr:hypothetical protein [Dysgonomonas massiliensis]